MNFGKSFRFEAVVETLVDLDSDTIDRLPFDVAVVLRGFWVGAPSGPDEVGQ